MSYVLRNNLSTEALRMTMDFTKSENVIVSRISMTPTVTVPPNEAKVMAHIMPRFDDLSWACKWSCQAEWVAPGDVTAREDDVYLNLN